MLIALVADWRQRIKNIKRASKQKKQQLVRMWTVLIKWQQNWFFVYISLKETLRINMCIVIYVYLMLTIHQKSRKINILYKQNKEQKTKVWTLNTQHQQNALEIHPECLRNEIMLQQHWNWIILNLLDLLISSIYRCNWIYSSILSKNYLFTIPLKFPNELIKYYCYGHLNTRWIRVELCL